MGIPDIVAATPPPDPDGKHAGYFTELHDPDPAVAMAVAAAIGVAATAAGKRVIVVSACLLGEQVRYDGGHKYTAAAVDALGGDQRVVVLPLCPEILGRMGCPRPAIHFSVGDGSSLAAGATTLVVDDAGNDHTAALYRGATLADALAKSAGAQSALLKERSPSCGISHVHGPDGVQPGMGAFAAYLASRGLPLQNESSRAGPD
jgi:uncharacterized protein YbbK (DUF523 family)